MTEAAARFRGRIYDTFLDTIGATPIVRLAKLAKSENVKADLLGKCEFFNPLSSVKDRIGLAMIETLEAEGKLKPGATLVEPTSGNTGIALAMVAAIRGYKMVLIMPDDLSTERRSSMKVYGAELILTPASQGGMEHARDLATRMVAEGKGKILDQFANPDNPLAHVRGTGPEIWRDTDGTVTHFVSAMGTTGTITGTSRFLKQQNRAIQIVGAQPAEGSKIPGIRKWPEAYQPKIYDASAIDRVELVSQADAEEFARRLARDEGIFGGVSSGGALWVALRIAGELERGVVVFIVCDRGDRYLSTGVF